MEGLMMGVRGKYEPSRETFAQPRTRGTKGKICRRCIKFREWSDYTTKRHRVCIPCHTLLIKAHLAPNALHGMTVTREGMARYHRQRYRDKQGLYDVEPPKTLPASKLCRRCQRRKPLSEFGSWRVRVCLDCDGPTLEELLRDPPIIRE